MRRVLIYILGLILWSCTDMHDPILHSGGSVVLVPEIVPALDSVAIDRMERNFTLQWSPDIFWKDINDFNVRMDISGRIRDIDFIEMSPPLQIPSGIHKSVWRTNAYYNNRLHDGNVYTDALSDTIRKQPDFTYSVRTDIEIPSAPYIRKELPQRAFLYIIQVTLKNNNGRVINSGRFSVSGLAEGYNVYSENTFGNSYYILDTRFYQMSEDVVVGTFTSFGLPGCDPYELRDNIRRGYAVPIPFKNIIQVQLVYREGRILVPVEVTDQFLLQPTGGLILIELDIDDLPQPDTGDSDPFEVLVNDYENVDNWYNSF